MRVLSVVGNRPQFIKSAPLSPALREAGIDEVVLHTGQHYDRGALAGLLRRARASASRATGSTCRRPTPTAMVPGIRAAVAAERPDWVLVYGDTNSTLAGARGRGRDRRSPTSRRGCGASTSRCPRSETGSRSTGSRRCSSAPTSARRSSSRIEGVAGRREVVGDVMADANRLFAPIARERSQHPRRARRRAAARTRS